MKRTELYTISKTFFMSSFELSLNLETEFSSIQYPFPTLNFLSYSIFELGFMRYRRHLTLAHSSALIVLRGGGGSKGVYHFRGLVLLI